MDMDLLSKGWIKSFPAAAVLNWLANRATSICLVQMNITSTSVKHWADKNKRFAASSVSTFRLCAGFTRKWSAGSVTWWSASKRVHKMPSSCCIHAVDSKTIFLKKKKKAICVLAQLRFLAPTRVSISLRWERGSGSEACNLSSRLQGLCTDFPRLYPHFNLLPVLSGLLCSVWGSCSLLEKKEAIEWLSRVCSVII